MLSVLATWISALFFKVFIAGYLNGADSFPKPLTSEEEEKYTLLLAKGDENARNVLIEHNLRLVAHIVKKYAKASDSEQEDLISIGTIGLIKAIDNFDPEKNIRLATFASRCIANEILMYMRAKKNRSREISLQDPIGTDEEGNSISLLNVLYEDGDDIDDSIVLKSNIEKLYKAIDETLEEREKLIIALRYGLFGKKAHTQREIAKKLGISRSYVSRIEKKILEKLEGEFKSIRF